ncbi:MAG: phosphoglucosamine mutase [Acidimicrobiia bacterium]|nr:phosphoglucosamine mutase [Acidimicrobiia bacterium]
MLPAEGRRLFGTDGIRGRANVELTADLALAIGRAAGEFLPGGQVLVGRDTRRSGEMLSSALQAGFHSVGVDMIDVGVLPSGGIAYLTGDTRSSMGVVVSASHNPAADNGIKLLGRSGSKLSDDTEDRIEQRIRRGAPWKVARDEGIGTTFRMAEAEERYLAHLRESMPYTLRGISIVLDCANGAAFRTAPELFRRLKADVEVFAAEPDGTNINAGCGATHPRYLSEHAKGRLGFAFDGDADRLIAVDEDGAIANGDVVMAVIARHMKEAGRLKNNVVVSTVMANLGFRRAMERLGIDVVETQVGDRYVLEAMQEHKAVLGGEQSGHIILADRAGTGDGLLTAVRLLEVMASSGKELRELRKETITEYPQVLRNVHVADKHKLAGADLLWAAVREAEARLRDDGRILVRASGTESLVRVMVEASSGTEAAQIADELVEISRGELGPPGED